MKKMLSVCIVLLLLTMIVACDRTTLGESSATSSTPVSIVSAVNPGTAHPDKKGLQKMSLSIDLSAAQEIFQKTFPGANYIEIELNIDTTGYFWSISATDGTSLCQQEIDAESGEVVWEGKQDFSNDQAAIFEDLAFSTDKIIAMDQAIKNALEQEEGNVSTVVLKTSLGVLNYYITVEQLEANIEVVVPALAA